MPIAFFPPAQYNERNHWGIRPDSKEVRTVILTIDIGHPTMTMGLYTPEGELQEAGRARSLQAAN